MVRVQIGDIFWELQVLTNDAIRIERVDTILGYITKQVPQSDRLLAVALDGIRDDISKALEEERKNPRTP